MSKQRTGRELALEAETRQAAIDALLRALDTPLERARIDPSRTLVELDGQRWTLVAVPTLALDDASIPPSLRRAGAKHKHVR